MINKPCGARRKGLELCTAVSGLLALISMHISRQHNNIHTYIGVVKLTLCKCGNIVIYIMCTRKRENYQERFEGKGGKACGGESRT